MFCYVTLCVVCGISVPNRYLTNYSDFKFQSSYDADASQLIRKLGYDNLDHWGNKASLVMVGYYGYEIWRHKKQVVKPFWSKNACFFNFFQQ